MTEEVVYRGLLIAAGVGVFGLSPYLAAFLAALVYGLAHLYQGWRGVFLTTLVGIAFGAIFLGTGSLLLTVLVHLSADVRALVVVPLSSEVSGSSTARAVSTEAPTGPGAS